MSRSLSSALWRVDLANRSARGSYGLDAFAPMRAHPDLVRSVIASFAGDDEATLLAIASAIEGAITQNPYSMVRDALLSEYMFELRAAGIPIRVDLAALRRCCAIAWPEPGVPQLFASN